MFHRKLKEENFILKQEVAELKKLLQENKLPLIQYNIEDRSPSDTLERKAYMTRVALFFQEIFNDRLKLMISEQQQELSNPTNPEKYDQFIKGTINALSLLLDWGDQCINEHLADNQNKNNGEV